MNNVLPKSWEHIPKITPDRWIEILTSGDIYFMPSWAQTFSNGQCESSRVSSATRKGVSVVGHQPPSASSSLLPSHTFYQLCITAHCASLCMEEQLSDKADCKAAEAE